MNQQIQTVRVDKIHPGDNHRKTFDERAIAGMAENFKALKVAPIIWLRPSPKTQGMYEIVMGERRWRAFKLMGLEEIEAMVGDWDYATARQLMLSENLNREDLDPIEEAQAFQSLVDEGETVEKIARFYNVTLRRVEDRLKLLALNSTLQSAVASGQLKLTPALQLARLDANRQFIAIRQYRAGAVQTKETMESIVLTLGAVQLGDTQLNIFSKHAQELLERNPKPVRKKITLPANPIRDNAPDGSTLAEAITFWNMEERKWRAVGKQREADFCLVAQRVLKAAKSN